MDARIFLRKDHTNKDGTQGIYLRYSIDRKSKKDFTLNLPINPDCWDENLCRVNKKDPLQYKINLLIDKNLNKANSIIYDARINDTVLSYQEFERLFKGSSEKESFIAFARRYYTENPKKLATETIRTYLTDISELEKYKADVSFKEINQVKFISDYEKYLKENDSASNTIYKKLKLFRAVLYIAKKQKLIQYVVFEDYPIKFYQTEKVYFTKTELNKLENLQYDNKLKFYQLKVLEYFLFACYTGIRVGDLSELRFKNIIE